MSFELKHFSCLLLLTIFKAGNDVWKPVAECLLPTSEFEDNYFDLERKCHIANFFSAPWSSGHKLWNKVLLRSPADGFSTVLNMLLSASSHPDWRHLYWVCCFGIILYVPVSPLCIDYLETMFLDVFKYRLVVPLNGWIEFTMFLREVGQALYFIHGLIILYIRFKQHAEVRVL